MDDLDKQIAITKETILDLRHKISEWETSLKILLNKKCELDTGLKIGCRVKDRKGTIYIVKTINHNGWTKPWVKGNPIKKNGEPSTMIRNLLNEWKVIKEGDE